MKKEMRKYITKEDAEAETGYFSVYSIKISKKLSLKISDYVSKEGISTYSRENIAETSWNTYTVKWVLRSYQSFSYISSPGAWGEYKQTKIRRDKERGASVDKINNSDISGSAPGEYDWISKFMDDEIKKLELLERRTPSVTQMYFWICKKYFEDIYEVNYSKNRP